MCLYFQSRGKEISRASFMCVEISLAEGQSQSWYLFSGFAPGNVWGMVYLALNLFK